MFCMVFDCCSIPTRQIAWYLHTKKRTSTCQFRWRSISIGWVKLKRVNVEILMRPMSISQLAILCITLTWPPQNTCELDSKLFDRFDRICRIYGSSHYTESVQIILVNQKTSSQFLHSLFMMLFTSSIETTCTHEHATYQTHAAEGKRGGTIEVLATVGSIILMVLTFPISIFICFKGKYKNHYSPHSIKRKALQYRSQELRAKNNIKKFETQQTTS